MKMQHSRKVANPLGCIDLAHAVLAVHGDGPKLAVHLANAANERNFISFQGLGGEGLVPWLAELRVQSLVLEVDDVVVVGFLLGLGLSKFASVPHWEWLSVEVERAI